MSTQHPPDAPPRVLVIDDNRAIHADFRKVLSPSLTATAAARLASVENLLFGDEPAAAINTPVYEVDFATQGEEGLRLVEQAQSQLRPYALAFVDMRMPPGWDGLETIEHIWRVDPGIQVVICSAYSDYDWSDMIERLGHSDRLLVLKKPFEPIEIQQCASAMTRKWLHERQLSAHLQALEQQVKAGDASLQAANRQLRHITTHDTLTSLPSRALLDDRLNQAITHARRYGFSFSVLVADLDRFKAINDSLGRRAGDLVLGEMAQRLSGAVRGIDTVARLSGDEFALILSPSPPASQQDALQVAQQLNAVLQQPFTVQDVRLHVSASIGVVQFPEDGDSAEVLLAHADAAMSHAKRCGRNNAQRFGAGINPTSIDRVSLKGELHNAVALGQLELFYQPKADINTDDVHSAEALVRWRHPQRGLISPDQFIPLAEESGLIHDIGLWVLNEACRQCAAWQQEGLRLRIAVNVSASQFRQGRLLEQVRNALASSRLDPRSLELELTESAVMTNPEQSAATLEQLSRMGVLLSVDDFGTGYSSMSYLQRFPIDKLKIDRSFVKDLVSRAEDASIVRAIISLAHGLKLKVVAEGVETFEQLKLLQALGCDQYQGYHFSPPMPAGEFEQRLRGWQNLDGEAEDPLTRTYSKLTIPEL